MANNEARASDVGTPGPGAPTADLSARNRRAIGDEAGIEMDKELEYVWDLPTSGQIKCGLCVEHNRCFLREGDLEKHIGEQHPQYRMKWRYAHCSKSFDKLHGCRCHLPKCKGRSTDEEGAFRCTSYGSTFKTQRGLSQHERHAHPVVRNQKRMAAAEKPNRPRNRASAWSKEEVELLIRLNELFKHERQPNKRIGEFLTTKTLKQISDKKRLLPTQRVDTVAENVESDEESGSSHYESATEEAVTEQEDDDASWRDILETAIYTDPLPNGTN